MTAFVLKLLALASMVCDHTAIVCNDFSAEPLLSATAYAVLRTLGRAALPLYAFLVAEGFRHTRSASRYAARLLVMGVFVQVAYALVDWFSGGGSYLSVTYLNIMITLGCGVLLLMLLQRITSVWGKLACVALAGAVYAAVTQLTPLTLDYGFWALALIVALYFAKSTRGSAVVLALWACLFYWGQPAKIALAAAVGLLVLLYNGKKGMDDHHWLYFAYPAHFALIYGSVLLLTNYLS